MKDELSRSTQQHGLLDEDLTDEVLEKQRDDMKAAEGSIATVVFLGTASLTFTGLAVAGSCRRSFSSAPGCSSPPS